MPAIVDKEPEDFQVGDEVCLTSYPGVRGVVARILKFQVLIKITKPSPQLAIGEVAFNPDYVEKISILQLLAESTNE